MLEWDEMQFVLDCNQWGILNFIVKTWLKKVFFIFNLVFENEFGASLPALDAEALCLSPEWIYLAWQLDSFSPCQYALVSVRGEEMTSGHWEDEGRVKSCSVSGFWGYFVQVCVVIYWKYT